MSRLPAIEALREINDQLLDDSFFRWLKADWRRAKKELKSIRATKSARFADLSDKLNELVTYCEFLEGFESNVEYRNKLGTLFRGSKTEADKLIGLRAWYKAIRKKYGIGFGPNVAVGDSIIGMPLQLARALRSLSDRGLRRQIEQVESNVAALAAMFPNERGLHDEYHTLVGPTASVTVLTQHLWTMLASFVGAFVSGDSKLSECFQVLRRLEKLEALIAEQRDNVREFLESRQS